MSLFGKKPLSMDEQRPGENINIGHCNTNTDVSTSLNAPLSLIQQSLSDIHVRLNKLDSVEQCVRDIKQDLWGNEGLDEKITYVAQQCEDSTSDIASLKVENVKLRKDMELLKSVIVKLDRKVNEQSKEILNLKGRSMRDNILIHNFNEVNGEDLMEAVPAAIKEHLNIDVTFVRIHRNSPTPNRNGKPRTITGKLVDISKKGDILKAQKAKRDANIRLPFNVTPQSPPEVVEKRKELFEISQKYNQQNVKTRVVGEKLVFPDKSTYKDRVVTPKAEDILFMDDKETEKLDKINTYTSSPVVESGNKFITNATNVNSMNDVRRFYKKIVSIPEYTQAHHNILVFRFKDREDKLQEGYVDDGEFGAGRKLLKFLIDNGHTNTAFVVTQWYSGQHIGPKRFSIMEEIIGQTVGQM